MVSQSPIRLVGGTASPLHTEDGGPAALPSLALRDTWGQPDQYCDAIGLEKPKPIFHAHVLLRGGRWAQGSV